MKREVSGMSIDDLAELARKAGASVQFDDETKPVLVVERRKGDRRKARTYYLKKSVGKPLIPALKF